MWGNSSFKVFIKKNADTEKLQNELTRLDQTFFKEYQLKLENRKLMMAPTMKQGDSILGIEEGTLGGFVAEISDPEKIYALTCNHVFPYENLAAFADNSSENEIGRCVFTTRNNCIDFAAVEMNESADCDVAFRNEDGKKTNAKVYDGNIKNIGFMHKIGTTSGATTGSIISSEYYDKVYDNENRDFLFLVGGGDGQPFAENGDSGSLVFSRPFQVEQNQVNIVGMVVGTYQKEDERSDDDEGTLSRDNTSLLYEREEHYGQDINADPEHISCCYKLSPALKLFEEHNNVSVKFKDDLPSSGSSSSSTSFEDSA